MPNAQEWLDQEYPLEIRNKVTWLDIKYKNLTDELKLIGFSNLTTLNCSNNQLTNLDLSPCPNLTELNCSNNQLTNLDLSPCPNLTELDCFNNQLTNLDLSPCPNLTELNCSYSKLTNLDLSPCPNLTELDCSYSKLTNLDLSPCPNLTELDCYNNQLTNLDLSLCPKLIRLDCYNNQKLDIPLEILFKLTNLEKFNCSETKLAEKLKTYGNYAKDRDEDNNEFYNHTYLIKIAQQDQQIQLLKNQQSLFAEKEDQINYLETRIKELIILMKEQGDKIFQVLSHLFPEKDLLRELIRTHLDFAKAKKQGLDATSKLRKKFNRIYDKLEEKWGEEKMKEVELVLQDFEDMVTWEIELEVRLQDKSLRLEQQRNSLITDNNEKKRKTIEEHEAIHNKQLKENDGIQELKLELAEMKGQITVLANRPTYQTNISHSSNVNPIIGNNNQITNNYQQTIKQIEQEINQSLANTTITPQDQKIINQTTIFLGTQEIFLNYRQELISNLITSYCQLAKKSKFTKLANRTTQLMNISSKLIGSIPSGNIAQSPLNALGTIINLTQNTLQEKDLKNYLKKLQAIFTEDKNALILFDKNYRALINSIQFNNSSEIVKNIINCLQLDHTQLTPFKSNHNIYKLGEIWEDDLTNLNLEQLKVFLTNLDKKLSENQQEFQSQRKSLASQEWFKLIDKNTDLLQEVEQLQTQIGQIEITK